MFDFENLYLYIYMLVDFSSSYNHLLAKKSEHPTPTPSDYATAKPKSYVMINESVLYQFGQPQPFIALHYVVCGEKN